MQTKITEKLNNRVYIKYPSMRILMIEDKIKLKVNKINLLSLRFHILYPVEIFRQLYTMTCALYTGIGWKSKTNWYCKADNPNTSRVFELNNFFQVREVRANRPACVCITLVCVCIFVYVWQCVESRSWFIAARSATEKMCTD